MCAPFSHRLAVWLACLVRISILALAPMPAWATDAQAVQTLQRAHFESAGAPLLPVALPDTWAHRGVPVHTPGRYHLRFELAAVPDESLALAFTRLSSWHHVYVNGTLVSGHGQSAGGSNPGIPVPVLVNVPPSTLRAGVNHVRVDVRYSMRAGLSEVTVGPMSTIKQTHLRHLQLNVALPQALNMATGGLALFMILIWWLRRSELALGSFGALVLLGSIRNYSYFLDTALGSAVIADWIFYSVNVVIAVLLGTFAQAFAGVRWPRYSRLLLAGLVLLPAVGLGVALQGKLQVMRGYTYPFLLAACLPALWLCVERARARGGWTAIGQAVGIGAMLGAVAHDYAMQTANWLPITHTFWMPFVMPLALGMFSLALMHRMVKAMGEVEALNTELEARVRARTAELEQANAAKTRFLASASHDLRQPLVAIGLLVGLARDQSESPKTRQVMDRVDEAVGAMEGLLTGLLDLSQLESGVVRPDPVAVRLSDVFSAIEAHEQPGAALKGLRLRLRPTTVVVRSDPVMLERIVRNLVANAVRYTAQGGVLVAARRRGGMVRLEVRDTGIGIAPEHQHTIFQEFVQLDNPGRDRSRGMGLGLAIVQRSAALLGHRIGVASTPGKGSCFWLELPQAHAPAALPQAARVAPGGLKGRHILIVEDDLVVREAMVERLQAWGARVEACASLDELQRWLDRHANEGWPAPDAMVSDYRLPQGTGLDAIAAVHARFGAVPALLVTGDTAPQELMRLDASGVPVLHKPFRPEALLAALQSASMRDRLDGQPQAQPGGSDHGLRAGVGVELAEDGREMGLDGRL